MKARAVFICFSLLLPTLFLLAPVIPVEAQRGNIVEQPGERAAYAATEIERAAAENFVPLVGIPYIQGNTVNTFGDYVNAFYFASISIAAFLAVVRIIFAGVKYMLSDIVTTKQEAKKDIRTALLGLLIVVGAVLILNTINTNLTNIKLFTDAPVPSIGGNYVAPPDCIATQVTNIQTGQTQCIAVDGDDCDVSQAGGLCGCGQRLVALSVEPGYDCQAIETEQTPGEEVCPFPIQGGCPCGQEPGGLEIAGYYECVDSNTLPESTTPITFNGQTIDPTTVYTVHEPAIPELTLPEGEYHGQSGTIVGIAIGGEISTTFTDGETSSSQATQVAFRLQNGEVLLMGCTLFTPSIPGCRI